MVILANIGIPALANITQQRRSEVAAIGIADTFRYARSEALRRNTNIYICGANITVTGSFFDCVNNTDWSEGVFSFLDYSSQGVYRGNADLTTWVKLTKFESSSVGSVTVTSASSKYVVDSRSMISALGNDNLKNFCFYLEQKINNKIVKSKLLIDSYGNATYCKPDDLTKCSECNG